MTIGPPGDWAKPAERVLRGVIEGLREDQQGLAPEIMRIDRDAAAVVVVIGGTDMCLTISALPFQRPRPGRA